jgi:hypothetical protein
MDQKQILKTLQGANQRHQILLTAKQAHQDFVGTFALGWMTGFLAAKGFPADADETPVWKTAEQEGLVEMAKAPVWGSQNVEAYKSLPRNK